MNVQNRTIFSNDNLPVLRGIDTESVDLIYLDPPFNSNRNYAAPIGSDAAGETLRDTEDDLQLLCGACNSTKGKGTQAELISRLKAQGIL